MTVTDYLASVNERLVTAGHDDYLLRIESKRVWRPDGTVSGGDALIGQAQGELAELIIEHEGHLSVRNYVVTHVIPKPNITYGVASVLKEALT